MPQSPGDLAAETYYDNGGQGRIGTSLPVYAGPAVRDAGTILAGTSDGNPRLLLFTSDTGSGAVTPHTARLNVQLAGRNPQVIPITIAGGTYSNVSLVDLIGNPQSEALVSVDTDDPTFHAVLVRSDPVTGSPFLTASN